MRPGTVDVVRKIFEPILQKFMAENPGIKVEMVDMGWGEWANRMQVMIATRSAPDVQLVSQGYLYSWAADGAYLDLTPFIDAQLRAELPPSLWNASTLGGKIYQVPASIGGFVLWYNAELFQKAGLDPNKPPRNWDELLAYAKQIKEKTGVPGLGIHAKAFADLVDQFANFYQSQSGKPLWDPATQKFNFDSKEGIEVLQFLQDLVHVHKVTQPNPEEFTRADLRPLFRDGKLGMHIDGPWIISVLAPKHKLGEPDSILRTAPLPAGRAGSHPFFGADGWAISANTKHPEAAWKLLRFLVQTDNQFAHTTGYGIVPVGKAERQRDVFLQPHWKDLAAAIDTGFSRMQSKHFIALSQAVEQMTQKVLVKAATPEQAIKEAVKAAAELK